MKVLQNNPKAAAEAREQAARLQFFAVALVVLGCAAVLFVPEAAGGLIIAGFSVAAVCNPVNHTNRGK